MRVTTPDWLARHGGALSEERAEWAVYFDGAPQYVVAPVPAGGKFGVAVTQTINGRRLDRGGVYPSAEEAVRGGLEDLRRALGW